MENYKPTDSELEILQILWKNGPNTVKFVNDELNKRKEVGYTTTLKTMQIMFDKKILSREKSGRSHTYKAVSEENETKNQLIDKILDSAFGGSASKLVMQALGNRKTSEKEISEIRELLNKIEKDSK